MDPETHEKLLAQSLLRAAARHDVAAVKNLLRSGVSANVQDAETGFTPLHAAIAACAPPNDEQNGTKASSTSKSKEQAVADVVRLLFENGAIWNDLDKNDETPGCVAHRLGLREVYELVVDAGVRAELLLARLDEIEPQKDDDEEDGEDESMADGVVDTEAADKVVEKERDAHAPATTGAEITTTNNEPPEDYIDHWDSNADFLRSTLRYTDTQLLDSSSNAVMMDWETEIMQRHADTLIPTTGLRAVNIGHGMGIVDTAIQSHHPSSHHIIEAHPAVLERLRANGWYDKPGVTIHEGRWQDVMPKLVEKGVVYDAIYYDTFAEDYKDLKELFSEYVVTLMDPAGRFGFYNGLGADRQVCYDVYTKVVELDLHDAGLGTEWEELSVPKVEWTGVRRPYWNVDLYRLPVCKFSG